MQSLKNLTTLQWIGIVLVINGAITGGVNEMTDLLGSVWAKHAVSLATIGSSICGGLNIMFGGIAMQASNIAAVIGSDGRPAVRINVNGNAPASLASAAIDPAQKNIGAASPGDRAILTETAKAAS